MGQTFPPRDLPNGMSGSVNVGDRPGATAGTPPSPAAGSPASGAPWARRSAGSEPPEGRGSPPAPCSQDCASRIGRPPKGAMSGFVSSGARPFASSPRKLMPTPMSVPASSSTARCQKRRAARTDQVVGKQDVDRHHDRHRRLDEGDDVADAQDRAGDCAAQVGREVQGLLAAEGLAHHQEGDDHARQTGDGGCQRGEERRVENRLQAAVDGVGVVAQIQRVVDAPVLGDGTQEDGQVERENENEDE